MLLLYKNNKYKNNIWHISCYINNKEGTIINEAKNKNLIENEDKKNPLTDEAISSRLNIRREDVTFLRNELKIEDSRQRRKVVLIKAIKDILKEEKL